MEGDLARELKIVERLQKELVKEGPFVSLAEASRKTGVPLPTLAQAVRERRVPALRVQQRRWLVRVAAVRSYFGDRSFEETTLQQRLAEAGLIDQVRSPNTKQFAEFEPVPYQGNRSVSEWLVEERR